MLSIVCQKEGATVYISCGGAWTVHSVHTVDLNVAHYIDSTCIQVIIDCGDIAQLDMAGATALLALKECCVSRCTTLSFEHLSASHAATLDYIQRLPKSIAKSVLPSVSGWRQVVEQVGMHSIAAYRQSIDFITFIGDIAVNSWHCIRGRQFNWPYFIAQIESTGVNALPIVGLLSFLIGVVLVYQMGIQLEQFGANIYIVDLMGLAIFREFAPLLTAIIIAARSGAALTAEIGTMKLNQELDALFSMGISPIQYLIIPKLLSQLIVLPLLTVWSALMSLLGGIWMSNLQLKIDFHQFVLRLHEVIPVRHFLLGILKAPFFAFIIAAIGAFRGLSVTNSSASVGEQTTISVVNAIFLIIVIDAIFSVIYSAVGL